MKVLTRNHLLGRVLHLGLLPSVIAGLDSITFATVQLPTTLLNPTVLVVTGATITVCSSGCTYNTVQAAWNAASGGDEIVITAGQTFTTAGVLLNMSNKAGTSYILIRSSASGSFTTGVRVGSANAANMPKLQVTVNSTAVSQRGRSLQPPGPRCDGRNRNAGLQRLDRYFIGISLALSALLAKLAEKFLIRRRNDVSGFYRWSYGRAMINSDQFGQPNYVIQP